MILIFDLGGGLCNQIIDINCSIDFAVKYNYQFSFRHCSFRYDDLQSFDNKKKFNDLFDENIYKIISNYIPFKNISLLLNNDNTINYVSTIVNTWAKSEIDLINSLNTTFTTSNKKYIIIKQLFSIYNIDNIKNNIYTKIFPNNKIMKIYNHIKKYILPKKYNFIHYRYENDFTTFFNIKNIKSIDYLIDKIYFKNRNLKIYIACSNLKKLSNTKYLLNNFYKYKNIIIKDDYLNKYGLNNLNFEEKAFIDFMIGKNAQEVYGHNKSSFSLLLNFIKNTNNYYNNL
jgi:hypothetical protein